MILKPSNAKTISFSKNLSQSNASPLVYINENSISKTIKFKLAFTSNSSQENFVVVLNLKIHLIQNLK